MTRFATFLRPLLAVLLGTALPAAAQTAPAQPTSKIKVYLVGTFHFSGSQSDVVKSTATDMQNAKKRQEIEDLVNRLSKTNADKVFVEWGQAQQRFVDSTYALYRKNQFLLRNNEVQQVGYRLANKLGRSRVYCADAAGVFDYDAAVTYAKAHGQEDILTGALPGGTPDSVGRLIRARTRSTAGWSDKDNANETIVQKLARMNSDDFNRTNMDAYLLGLARVGGGDNYAGADLAGEFYKRNMRIYTNLLRAVDVQHDKAIILVIGAGHVGFLKEQLQYSSLFEVQDVLPLLRAQ